MLLFHWNVLSRYPFAVLSTKRKVHMYIQCECTVCKLFHVHLL